MPQVRLTRKYASVLNGFDLSTASVGDIVLVTDEVAAMLRREGWAEAVVADTRDGSPDSPPDGVATPIWNAR